MDTTVNLNDPIYDIKKVSDLLGLDVETIQQLAKMLLIKTQETNDKLKEAILITDCKSIMMLAHDIKGSCANFHFTKISELAAPLEKMAKEQIIFNGIALEICEQIDVYITRYQKEIQY